MGKEYLDITAEDFVLAKTDDEVFNKIYNANEKLVYFCMQKCANMNIPEDELYNTLVDGLIKSINKFNPDKNASFMTFATYCMINNARALLRDYHRSKDTLIAGDTFSFDTVIADDKGEKNLSEVLTDGSYEEYHDNEIKEEIDTRRLLSFLKPAHRKICELYYEGRTQVEVAEILGHTRPYITKVVAQCLKLMQKLAKTSLDVNSFSRTKMDKNKVATVTGLNSIYEVKYYDEVYDYLYNGLNNLDELKFYGKFTKNPVPFECKKNQLEMEK